MNSPKPPLRCPTCGAQLAELAKRWNRMELPTRRVVRYPTGVSATYHCGARIESQFVARPGMSGLIGQAFWELIAVEGCRERLADDLASRRRLRVKVKR
jgi:hypothetical protein